MKTPEQMAQDKAYELGSNNVEFGVAKDAFLAGYQAAMNSPEKPDTCEHILDMKKMVDVNSSSGWISVKERLPEEDVAVLTYGQVLNNPPEVIGVRRRYNGDQEWKHTWESEDGFIYREDDVTHWMPLPKPPEEK